KVSLVDKDNEWAIRVLRTYNSSSPYGNFSSSVPEAEAHHEPVQASYVTRDSTTQVFDATDDGAYDIATPIGHYTQEFHTDLLFFPSDPHGASVVSSAGNFEIFYLAEP